MDVLDFQVRKDDLRTTAWVSTTLPALAEGQALLKVGKFALTANNITYAAVGDMARYWQFFPAVEGWGRIPVWGFAEVAQSKVEGLAVGERLYGYFPMSSHLVVSVDRLSDRGFVDATPHRASLPPVYNQYIRVAADASFAALSEDVQAIFRPLFMTSFLIDDVLADSAFFGADSVILSSASSKTSLGTAFALARRGGVVEIVGLTSPANLDFVKSLGLYDRVLLYSDIKSMPVTPSVFVDIAGDSVVRRAVHERLTDALTYSCGVGFTHWDVARDTNPLPGPAPAMFFAPDVIRKRSQDWGPAGFDQRYAPVWADFARFAEGWLDVVTSAGQAQIDSAYAQVVNGRAPAHTGHILSV